VPLKNGKIDAWCAITSARVVRLFLNTINSELYVSERITKEEKRQRYFMQDGARADNDTKLMF
jgi:hypothetical protein